MKMASALNWPRISLGVTTWMAAFCGPSSHAAMNPFTALIAIAYSGRGMSGNAICPGMSRQMLSSVTRRLASCLPCRAQRSASQLPNIAPGGHTSRMTKPEIRPTCPIDQP